jgi:hypothetical protein
MNEDLLEPSYFEYDADKAQELEDHLHEQYDVERDRRMEDAQ